MPNQAWGTPAAVLIGPDGAIWSAVAQGADAIRALVEQAAREPGRLLTAEDPGRSRARGARQREAHRASESDDGRTRSFARGSRSSR